jgi:uncharacterized protein
MAVVVLASSGMAQAQSFPSHSGAVVDAAHIVDSTTAGWITRTVAALEAKTGDQIVVATVPSLDGRDIDSYVSALGQAWQLGQPDKNNGAILLIAPAEGQVAIQVGEGLRAALPDSLIRAVLDTRVIPALAANDIGGGIHDGVETLRIIFTAAFEDLHRNDPPQPIVMPQTREDKIFLNVLLGFIIFCLLAAAIAGLTMIGVIPEKRRGWWRVLDPIVWLASSISVGTSSSSSSSSSASGGGYSGGGGSFGGGGSSGSW